MEIKRGFSVLCFFILNIIFFCSLASAALGVSPAIYELDFTPGLRQIFDFNFFTESNVELEISAAGELSEYVTLNKEKLIGGGNVKALLELPEDSSEINPGLHKIGIVARQIISKEGGAVGTSITLHAEIRIRIPYPGKYADLDFSAGNANAGENVDFKAIIYSRGKESIVTDSYIEIYDSDNNKVELLPLGVNVINPAESAEISKKWNSGKNVPGRYNAILVVEYDSGESRGMKKTTAERGFRLGELFVDIANYTKEFEREKINKFDIVAESFWNDPIESVFAEVSIVGYDISFLTPSSNLEPFGKSILTGHFDTTPIEEKEFKAKILLNYKGKETEKIVDLKFKREINYLLISGILVGLILVIITAILFIKRYKKIKKK